MASVGPAGAADPSCANALGDGAPFAQEDKLGAEGGGGTWRSNLILRRDELMLVVGIVRPGGEKEVHLDGGPGPGEAGIGGQCADHLEAEGDVSIGFEVWGMVRSTGESGARVADCGAEKTVGRQELNKEGGAELGVATASVVESVEDGLAGAEGDLIHEVCRDAGDSEEEARFHSGIEGIHIIGRVPREGFVQDGKRAGTRQVGWMPVEAGDEDVVGG